MHSGLPINQLNETINYNEHFGWHPKGIEADLHDGLERGLPTPILHLAEVFLQNGACTNIRLYMLATYYASILMWWVCVITPAVKCSIRS